MSCSEYPTAQTAKTFKMDADTINEVVTSQQDRTEPASDGKTKKTMRGIENDATLQRENIDELAQDQRESIESTFSSQFSYNRIGNISLYVGDTLTEADKLNSYQYPDNSGDWYGPIQGQQFPITIPSNPSSDNGWALVSGLSDNWGTVASGREVNQRRGTNGEISAGTPGEAELWFNTTDKTIHMGDGSTVGGTKFANFESTLIRNETSSDLLSDARMRSGYSSSVKQVTPDVNSTAVYEVKEGLIDNGLDILRSTANPDLYFELVKNDVLNANTFGDITSNAKDIIERMVEVGNSIYLPSGEYDATDLDVITANKKVVIHGDTPSYDPTTDTKKGTWINGVLSSAGSDSIAIFDVGIDARLTNTSEGIVFSDPVKLDTVFIDRVIVIAKPTANHCLLVENTRRVDIGTVMVYGGLQGLAIKSEVFNIGAVFAFDQSTWGCTVRYSPNAPCSNGNINFVYCGVVNNAKGGGVICMNDQQGAALKNISFGRVIIDNGSAGFYITNGGNSVSAEEITVDSLLIDGVDSFAIQTFGPPKGFTVRNAHLKNCAGSVFTNSGACEDYQIENLTIENTPAPALISGSNHKIKGWTYKGASGVPAAFIQNESSNLQIFSMDQRITSVINQNGGTTIGGDIPSVKYSANGNLPAMVSFKGLPVQKTATSVTQNSYIDIYDLPAGSQQYMLRLQITAFTQAGRHSRTVEIAQNDIQYVSSSTAADAVFTVEKNGDKIQFKYIFSVTGTVDFNVSLDAFHEE